MDSGNEPKQKLLSTLKGKLILAGIIVVAIIIVIVSVMAYQDYQRNLNNTAECFLTLSIYGEDDRDEMLAGDHYRSDDYQKLKNKKSFAKAIANNLQAVIDDPDNNLGIFRGSNETFTDAIYYLEQEGIQSEDIRQVIHTFLQNRKADALAQTDDTTGMSQMHSLNQIIQDGQSEYYTDGILTTEELTQFYRQELDRLWDEKNYNAFTRGLGIALSDDLLDACYPDIQADLLDPILEVSQVYTVAKNNGGFYDGVQNASSSRSSSLGAEGMASIGYSSSSSYDTYYGDFCFHESHSSTHVDGLLDQASKDKYNKSSSSYNTLFRDKDLKGSYRYDSMQGAAKDGAKYVLCIPKANADDDNDEISMDCILLLSNRKLYVMEPGSDNTSGCYEYKGDFADLVKELDDIYAAEYSTTAAIGQAQGLLENEDYLAALEYLMANGTNGDPEAEETLKVAGLGLLRQGEYDWGLQALAMTEAFSALERHSYDELMSGAAESFDKDYTRQFCYAMSQASTPLTGDEIQAALAGQKFDKMPYGSMTFGANGEYESSTYYSDAFTWHIDGDTLVLQPTNPEVNPVVYQVYDFVEGYYLLVQNINSMDLLKIN